MLRDALRAAGVDVDGDADVDADGPRAGGDSTPRLGTSAGLETPRQRADSEAGTGGGEKKLVDLHDGDDDDAEKRDADPESDNEVPPDLLVSTRDDHEPDAWGGLSREDSNEIPAEFLAAHQNHDERFPGFGAVSS
ncbi:hypothetical protein VTH06DRAFT_5411 [Thermothelomyces fergusii]